MQRFMILALEELVALGYTPSSVQTQFFSKAAPPAVWILPISYQMPEYAFWSVDERGAGVGVVRDVGDGGRGHCTREEEDR